GAETPGVEAAKAFLEVDDASDPDRAVRNAPPRRDVERSDRGSDALDRGRCAAVDLDDVKSDVGSHGSASSFAGLGRFGARARPLRRWAARASSGAGPGTSPAGGRGGARGFDGLDGNELQAGELRGLARAQRRLRDLGLAVRRHDDGPLSAV